MLMKQTTHKSQEIPETRFIRLILPKTIQAASTAKDRDTPTCGVAVSYTDSPRVPVSMWSP